MEETPSPVLATHVALAFVSSEGNNKVSAVTLNHFPAYKWAHIKSSILRGAFCGTSNFSFLKKLWEMDG